MSLLDVLAQLARQSNSYIWHVVVAFLLLGAALFMQERYSFMRVLALTIALAMLVELIVINETASFLEMRRIIDGVPAEWKQSARAQLVWVGVAGLGLGLGGFIASVVVTMWGAYKRKCGFRTSGLFGCAASIYFMQFVLARAYEDGSGNYYGLAHIVMVWLVAVFLASSIISIELWRRERRAPG